MRNHEHPVDKLRQKREQVAKIGIASLVALLLVVIVFLLPPQNIFIVVFFIVVASIEAAIIGSLFLKPAYALLSAGGVGVFLLMNHFVGFQLINNLLLISGIIGIVILLRQKP